jgi:DNA-binding transcriptional LysR family regulator
MTLEQLRIFVAVAQRQHVTHAAEDLNLTQSAVSSAISALEARHGVRLFDRVGRSIQLNPMGQVFLDEARAVLARAAMAEGALAELGGLKKGRLSIHASQTIASYWLPSRLVAFHAAYPGIEVEIAMGNTAEAAKAVVGGAAELGLVEGEIDDPILSRQTLDYDHLVVVVGRNHPWAHGPGPALEAFDQSPWVLRERGSGTRSAFEAALTKAGFDPHRLNIALTLPANEAVVTAVAAGAGATAISASVAEPFLQAGSLRQIAFDLPARPYYLLRHKARYRSKAGDAFLDLVRADWARQG